MRARWDLLTIAALALGVAAVSSSAALIVYAAAPALAIAFWRNGLATGVLVPVTLATRRKVLLGIDKRDSVLAGVALAGHFGMWVPSVKLTTIATATALVCTQPIWAGLFSAWRGRPLGRQAWLGMGVAVAGVVMATGADADLGSKALLGDILALGGAVMAAVYTTLGARVRQQVSTTTYTTVCYGVAAAALLVVCLVARGADDRVQHGDLAGDPGDHRRPAAAGSFDVQLHPAQGLGHHGGCGDSAGGAWRDPARLGMAGPAGLRGLDCGHRGASGRGGDGDPQPWRTL